jgi:monoamine oxidase
MEPWHGPYPVSGVASAGGGRRRRSGTQRISRRDLLKVGGALGLATAAATAPSAANAARPGPTPGVRIAIVGTGLAGLTCAYELKQAGYNGTAYEASDRIGGRCWTLRGAFADGQLVERGGQLIDQGHTAIRHLASRLRLRLDNLLRAEANRTEPFYYFDGRPYTYAAATRDFRTVYQKLHRE